MNETLTQAFRAKENDVIAFREDGESANNIINEAEVGRRIEAIDAEIGKRSFAPKYQEQMRQRLNNLIGAQKALLDGRLAEIDEFSEAKLKQIYEHTLKELQKFDMQVSQKTFFGIMADESQLSHTKEGGERVDETRKMDDGSIFSGKFKNGILVEGKKTRSNGVTEKGKFERGMLAGEGTREVSDGTGRHLTEKGKFEKGRLVDGTRTFSDGRTEEVKPLSEESETEPTNPNEVRYGSPEWEKFKKDVGAEGKTAGLPTASDKTFMFMNMDSKLKNFSGTIFFSGEDWCPACEKIKPFMKQLATNNRALNMHIQLIDGPNGMTFINPQGKQHKLSGVPRVISFRNGQIVSESGLEGVLQKAEGQEDTFNRKETARALAAKF